MDLPYSDRDEISHPQGQPLTFMDFGDLPNAKDQPGHGIKYLRAGAVANTLCHGLGCIRLLGRIILNGFVDFL